MAVMNADERLEPGQLVLRRQFQRDDLLSRVWAGHVVADDADGLWIWVSDGSAHRDIGAADGRRFRDVPFGEWGRTGKRLREELWRGNTLMFHPPGEAYSLWLFFQQGEFASWYVNLEEPGTRWRDGTAVGIDTIDYDLDIVVQPDRTWRWKDEDEFADHLAYPDVYWVTDEAAVRAEGERVLKLVATGEFPFDWTRVDFRPDPTWIVPLRLPSGWDRPRATPPGNTAVVNGSVVNGM
jgi:protein associated with RNAse G/E